MMKKIFTILFLCAGSAVVSFAHSSEDGVIEDMLNVSLESLKGSYQKLSDQNRLVSSEIEGCRGQILSLRQELDSLESQKAKWSPVLNGQDKAKGMTLEDIYQREIEQLTDKLAAISEKVNEKVFQQKKDELDAILEQSKKNLRAARLKLDEGKTESAKAATLIAQLTARRAQLQRQFADRQASLDLGSAKVYARRLDQEIAKLRSSQRELEGKLAQASNGESVEIGRFTEEDYQLRRKFLSLHDENMRLKREALRLGTFAVSPRP